ncbi:MAG: ferrous iron transport protein B [Gracilibacteraceae bacterium]|jgi:ferrous iron transport protein B|nr:ferrous iron transport protein B [Gracilibacteraceae bacterium]
MQGKIALAGNPNCGKTTLFNHLTGSSQYVGNWPGVTVEKKEGRLKGYKNVVITDLPGIYSLSPYSPEEIVTRDYLVREKPSVIINIIDASNLERNLYLTTQILETGIPVVVALNMIDIVRKRGDRIDEARLAAELGCPVVAMSAVRGEGAPELIARVLELLDLEHTLALPAVFSAKTESVLQEQQALPPVAAEGAQARWYAVKLLERDEKAARHLNLQAEARERAETLTAALEKEMDDDSESIVTNERYEYVGRVARQAARRQPVRLTTSDRIDRIVTNRVLALPIFAAVMFAVYFISVTWIGAIVTEWTNDSFFGGIVQPAAESFLASAGTAEWMVSLVADGIIGGVGAVLGFVPQMMVLFILLSVLEDCGYMARIAFIMDRVFRRFGLSGKSFIPILIASGCGVPGIMSSRTIENEKDRRMTIMVTTFIPCGAKLPIIALIAGALFPGSLWVAPSMYFMGIAMIILSGLILKKTRLFAGDPAPFVMELPPYHAPGVKGVLIHMWERSKAFVVKAGTVIFVSCGLIWFLSSFGTGADGFGMVEAENSILAVLGGVIAPLFAPLGFGGWQMTVATITGLVAKENVVGTMGILFGLGEAAEDSSALQGSVAAMMTSVSALAFMVFNLLCAPCFAAIGAIRREMGNWGWTLIAVGYQSVLAYAVALMVNQFGAVLVLGAQPGGGTAAAVCVLLLFIWLLARRKRQNTELMAPA